MIIDATTLFDLLRLVVNRSDEKVKKLADSLFLVYSDNIKTVSPSEIKYCELYVQLCKEVIGNQLNISDHKVEIINIFKRHLENSIFKSDSYLKESLKTVLDGDISPVRIVDITKRLNNIVGMHVSRGFISKLYGHVRDSDISYSVDDKHAALENIKGLVDEFKATMLDVDSSTGKGGPIEVIDMSNRNSIKGAYKLYKERRVTHVLKTGLQGLNQMFGPAGGMALGESILFAARTHNFKSGMIMKMVQWIATHSTPPTCGGKVPMILVISLENEGYQNMMKLWQDFYIAIHGEPPPPYKSDDPKEQMKEDELLVDMIYEYFSRSPYTLVIERYLPSSFGYDEMVHLHEKYENAGFRIAATAIDILPQMKTHNLGSASKSGNWALLQELCNSVVNYFKAVGTTLITAIQLNKGAYEIAATGGPHPVKHYSERHFAGSIGIAMEFDFIAYMEIEKDDHGNSWLTICWGKHRYVENTPEAHKFVAYQFDPVRGLIDDINGPFTGSRNIHAKPKEHQQSVGDINDILGLSY